MTLIVIHGVESTGKTTLGRRMAGTIGGVFLPEYGRAFCEIHGTDVSIDDLIAISRAQQANIEVALGERPIVVSDTDSLMTAAWARMMHGTTPPALMTARKADLYLHCAPDTPFVQDGVRIFGEPAARARFDVIARQVLADAAVKTVEVAGPWDQRDSTAALAVERLLQRVHRL